MQQSRRVESELVVHIAEVDAPRLFRREACSSMFVYCTDVLKLSEHEAYFRIKVARASRKHPVLVEMLGDGRLHLSGIATLATQLDALDGRQRESLLRRATHQSKRKIEELVAEIAPKPDVPRWCGSFLSVRKGRCRSRSCNKFRTELSQGRRV